MAESSHNEGQDKLRLCPTCRMPISVLATKCRYCGEPVGRPRDEARKLTVDDLGGSSSSSYAPSGEVLDAIEAFRPEELTVIAQKEEPPRKWYHFLKRRSQPQEPKTVIESLGSLEERKIDIAPFSTSSKRRSSMVRRESAWGGRLFRAALIVIALAVLCVAGVFAKSWIEDYLTRRNTKAVLTIKNPAIEILDRNGPALDALKAAVETLSKSDTPDNRRVLDRAREQVRKEVHALLDSVPWTRAMLDQASGLVSQALSVDPASVALKDLKQEVNQELILYKMTIVRLDAGARQVVLRIANSSQQAEDIMYSEGGKVKGRLEVKRVTQDGVTLEDPLRKSAGGFPRRFKLSIDGTISMQ